MGLQITVLCKYSAALIEQLNGLSTVWIFFMGLQIAFLRECLVTLWTAKWFVTSVDYFMGLQIACLRECLATLWTGCPDI